MTADAERRAAENESKAAAARAAEAAAQEEARARERSSKSKAEAENLAIHGKRQDVESLTEKDRQDLASHLAGIGRPKAANPFSPEAFGRDRERVLFDAVGKAYSAELDGHNSPTGFLRIYDGMNSQLRHSAADGWKNNLPAISQWADARIEMRNSIQAGLEEMRSEYSIKFPKPPGGMGRPSHQAQFLNAQHIRDMDGAGVNSVAVIPRISTANWVLVELLRGGMFAIPRAEFKSAGFDFDKDQLRGHRITLSIQSGADGTFVQSREQAAGMGAGQTMAPSPKPSWAEKERER